MDLEPYFVFCLTFQLILGYSIWEPFCSEEKLYMPYVRVFKKGRNGAIVRDRGPGFIDLTGQKDIYVCTNGLVMMYYAKTSVMGDVYEAGELHWTPHHCELYNPSSNNGLRADFPKKSLLSILLIGHPHDFRLPAMQMFVAPTYDQKHGDYVNATSIIMIGTDGECIVEKGSERARLRIRLDNKNVIERTLHENKHRSSMNKPFEIYPPMFCQLDVQHKLGQNPKGLINLKIPNDAFVASRANGKAPLYAGTKYMEDSGRHDGEKDTGSVYGPRFRASETERWKDVKDEDKKVALLADQVYTALLADSKMHFIGCLRYPDFSEDQLRIIREKKEEYLALKESIGDILKNYTVSEKGNAFWGEMIQKPPWVKGRSTNETGDKTRFDIYFEGEDFTNEVLKASYSSTEYAIKSKKEQLATQRKKPTSEIDPAELRATEVELAKANCLSILWPFAAAYSELYWYVNEVGKQLGDHWETLEALIEDVEESSSSGKKKKERRWMKGKDGDGNEEGEQETETTTTEATTNEGGGDEAKNVSAIGRSEVLKMQLNKLSGRRLGIMHSLSNAKYDRRFQPYNPNLVREHERLLEEYALVNTMIKIKTQRISPAISSVETLTARFKLYKNLLIKAHDELIAAVKHVERSGCFSGPVAPPGDPFERISVDTMIEIADASKDEKGTPYEPTDPEYKQAKACYLLPTVNEACKSIKPNATRAVQLLTNVKGQGKDWEEEDQWRAHIFRLMEHIFTKACPYIGSEFPVEINRLIKGYLNGEPAGTGLVEPIIGSRLAATDSNYQGKIYNETYMSMAPNNWTVPPSTLFDPVAKLKPKVAFWDQIIDALEHCDREVSSMQFYRNDDDDQPVFITLQTRLENGTEESVKVDDLVMNEKADDEFAFNWAIEMNWRIFVTVLGICIPKHENKVPLITARFYALYSQDFLHPLRQIWMSHRDNPILRQILGNYYGSCKGDKWAKICMESSFVASGDRSFRPPRYLYVNAFTEMNYFTSGPMAGSSGMLGMVGNQKE